MGQGAAGGRSGQGGFATAQAMRDWIEEQFGVVYTRDSMASPRRTQAPVGGHVRPGVEPSGQCGPLAARPHPGPSGLDAR